MNVTDVLKTVARGDTLSAEVAEEFMDHLMQGDITPMQTAGFLAALAVRGETVDEIAGFARAMRKNGIQLQPPFEVLDTCGTGGDGANTFNISTAAAFVCAAAGIKVAKHGNRAVSSKSGSADVLAALGANIHLTPAQALDCLDTVNLCFLFAQHFHPAMKFAAEPRKQLGFRTVFNILGPLTNPAGATRQVLGVFRADLVETVAHVLASLGTRHAMVVHGDGGIDELSIQGPTMVAEVRDGTVVQYTVAPEDFGLQPAPLTEIVGGDAVHNAQLIRELFAGAKGPIHDVVVLNAGASLYVGGAVSTLAQGVHRATEILASGAAARALNAYIRVSNHYRAAEVAQ